MYKTITAAWEANKVIDAYSLPKVTEPLLHAEIKPGDVQKLWNDDNEELPVP